MSSSIKNEYRELIKKYLAGTISSDEMETLDRYYSLFRSEPDVTPIMAVDEIETLEDRLQSAIGNRIKQLEKPVTPIYKRMWFRVAAIAVVSFSSLLIVLKRADINHDVVKTAALSHVVKENHFLMLSDSSRIVLHAGSVLKLANNFKTGNQREVTLIGEAYFDIKHDNNRPFVIHTGNIKTTVLGTAFNIQAYAGQKTITVTVTRGRVKVERGSDLLAVLTPNKQLTARVDKIQSNEITKQVVATRSLEWAKTDMSFDNMPFSELALHLNKRYDVQISFKNPALTGCPITGSFNGTESLKEVLDILSQTRGTSYSIKGKQVIINGKGCNE